MIPERRLTYKKNRPAMLYLAQLIKKGVSIRHKLLINNDLRQGARPPRASPWLPTTYDLWLSNFVTRIKAFFPRHEEYFLHCFKANTFPPQGQPSESFRQAEKIFLCDYFKTHDFSLLLLLRL